jgi:DNA end-binding protein Ku
MYWPDEIRDAEFGDVDVAVKVRDQELAMARQLIESLTAEWEPEAYTDEYREALMQIVEAKINGEEIEVIEPEPTAKVVDLMEALKASVAAAKNDDQPKAGSGGSSASSGDGAAKKKTAASKKTSAQKKTSSTKKSTTRKKAVGE